MVINEKVSDNQVSTRTGSLFRALVILFSTHPWLFLGFLIAILSAAIYFSNQHWISILAATFFLGAMLGARLFIRHLDFFLGRASIKLNPNNPTRGVFDDANESTGLIELDQFLKRHRCYVSHLLETIAVMGEEAEKLVERYELLTANLAAAVVIRDSDNRIRYCSPYTEVLTGYPIATMYDSKEDFFLSITHPDDQATFRRALAVAAVGEPFQHRYRLFHKSGMEIWVETRTVPILNEQGEVSSSLSTTLDVTGTVRYQRQVEEKNKDLQDFTYMVSHDLKAPIATVKGMVNVLNEDFAKSMPQDSKEMVDHISKAADRLHHLVSSILEYSRVASQSISNARVDLNEVMSDVLADYATQIKETQASIELPSNLPSVLGGKTQLYQILSNLVGNAIKYRSPSKPLVLRVKAKELAFRHRVTLSFEDNGRGIPNDKLDSVFRPFQRAHGNDIEGSGIGLACVKKLAEKLGGTISVESAEDKGSAFTLELPLA